MKLNNIGFHGWIKIRRGHIGARDSKPDLRVAVQPDGENFASLMLQLGHKPVRSPDIYTMKPK
jgi:hypothetical protein